MNKPAIIIPVFKRNQSLKQLLWSIEKAHELYDVTLVFRYHTGAHSAVVEFINAYNWPFGQKRIINDSQAIGLDENLRRCGDLSNEYGSIIILEDDSLVSPFFYTYAQQALDFYENETKVGQISLYRYHHNSHSGLPFHLLANNNSAFMVQKTSTRGQAFTAKQWQKFKTWLSTKNEPDQRLPTYIKTFGQHNWELQHNQFLIENDIFSVWPKVSVSTNQGYSGTHHPNNIDAGFFQVPLQSQAINYRLPLFKNANQYDAFFEHKAHFFNKSLPLNAITNNQLCIDLNGYKPLSLNFEYWLTSKPHTNAIATFSDELKPIELNVLWQKNGKAIALCKKADLVKNAKTNHYQQAQKYFAENTDVGLRNYLRFKWLKYVERKKLKK
ncbi:MAG: hypothetical protein ACPGLV_11865 [Bacteroidia bacterium]